PLPDTTLAINRQTARVQFDNIVLATRYIGPIASTLTTGYDYNGDGHKGLGDVWSLVRLHSADKADMRADFNGDGNPDLRDALDLLLEVLRG
ncbi:hypothetical protein LLH00_06455, partial [bacterium]|nr:hypothetical protein [bacterium]